MAPTGGERGSARTITLYAKAECHLCDEARERLEDLLARRREIGLVEIGLVEIDIRRDDRLFERYRYRIPVIAVDGVERLEGRIEPAEIAALLDER